MGQTICGLTDEVQQKEKELKPVKSKKSKTKRMKKSGKKEKEEVVTEEDFEKLIIEDFRSTFSDNLKARPLFIPQNVAFESRPASPSEEVLNELIHDETVGTVTLFGEAGRGKTCRLIHFTQSLYQEFESGELKSFPIFFLARNIRRKYFDGSRDDMNNFVVDYLFKRFVKDCGVGISRKFIADFLASHDLIIILDGYDEFEQKRENERLLGFPTLDQLMRPCRLKTFKILIGSRKEALNVGGIASRDQTGSRNEENERTNEYIKNLFRLPGNVYKEMDLLTLNPNQVNEYLERFVDHHHLYYLKHRFKVFIDQNKKIDKKMYLKVFKDLPVLKDLCENPCMMFLIFTNITEIWDGLLGKDRSGQLSLEVARLKLFESITKAWFLRESARICDRMKFLRPNESNIRLALEKYSENLARQQYRRGRLKQCVSLEESLDPKSLEGSPKKIISVIAKTPNLMEIIRDSCLVKVKETNFMFFHNNIIEFFAMRVCVNEVQGFCEFLVEREETEGEEEEEIFKTDLNRRDSFFTRNISSELGVLKFMVEKVKDCLEEIGVRCSKQKEKNIVPLGSKPQPPSNLVEWLFRIIDLSKYFPKLMSIGAANSITILCYSGVSLGGMNFHGITVRNADFHYAILDQTDFSFSDLTGSVFRGCLLNETNFSGCCLRDCVFDVNSSRKMKRYEGIGNVKTSTVLCFSVTGRYSAVVEYSSSEKYDLEIEDLEKEETVFLKRLTSHGFWWVGDVEKKMKFLLQFYPGDILVFSTVGRDNRIGNFHITKRVGERFIYAGFFSSNGLEEVDYTNVLVSFFDQNEETEETEFTQLEEKLGKGILFWTSKKISKSIQNLFRKKGPREKFETGQFSSVLFACSFDCSLFSGCVLNQKTGVWGVKIIDGKSVPVDDFKMYDGRSGRKKEFVFFWENRYFCSIATRTNTVHVYRICNQKNSSIKKKEKVIRTPRKPIRTLSNVVCMSSSRSLYICRRDGQLVVVDFCTSKVVGFLPSSLEGDFKFHPKEDYVVFNGKKKLFFRKEMPEREEKKEYSTTKKSRSRLFYRNNEWITCEKVRKEDHKFSLFFILENHTLQKKVEIEFGGLGYIDRGMVLFQDNLKLEYFSVVCLDERGRRVCGLDEQGNVFTCTIRDDFSDDEGESYMFKKFASSSYFNWGVVGKLFGGVLGTVKYFYNSASFFTNEKEVFLLLEDPLRNMVEIWDYEKKRKVREVRLPLPRTTMMELKQIGCTERCLLSSFGDVVTSEIVDEGGREEFSALYDEENERFVIQYFALDYQGATPTRNLRMKNSFGLDIENFAKLKPLLMKNQTPYFGLMDHPAINLDIEMDLKQGDILLKFINKSEGKKIPLVNMTFQTSNLTQVGYLIDNSISSFLLGKKKFPIQNYEITHAAVYIGGGKMVEATAGGGVVTSSMKGKEKVAGSYLVFRLSKDFDSEILEKVVLFCREISLEQQIEVLKGEREGKKFYNSTGALFSVIFKKPALSKENWKSKYDILKQDRRQKKRRDKYFCSELAVHVYHLAAVLLGKERVIDLRASSAHPKELFEALMKSKKWKYVGNVLNTLSDEEKEEKEEIQKRLGSVRKDIIHLQEGKNETWSKNVSFVERYQAGLELEKKYKKCVQNEYSKKLRKKKKSNKRESWNIISLFS